MLSHIWLFLTPWTAACQASLFITNSRSLLKLKSIESLILCSYCSTATALLKLPTHWLHYFLFFISPLRRRQWHPTPVLLPGKSHGRKSLNSSCSPWGHWGSDTTEWLPFHFSLSCTEEGNGNPLQCSCLENPRDGGAWWAAAYGVAQSQTRLKRLSSSSSMGYYHSAPWFLYLIYFRHFKSRILFFYLDITKIKCLVKFLKIFN